MRDDLYTDTEKLTPLSKDIVLPFLKGKIKIHTFAAYSTVLFGADQNVKDVVSSIKAKGVWKCSADMKPFGLMHDVVVFDQHGQLVCIDIAIDEVRQNYAKKLEEGVLRNQPGAVVNSDYIDFAWRDGLSVAQAIEWWCNPIN